jgi:tRNA(Ile)-lysidine synthase
MRTKDITKTVIDKARQELVKYSMVNKGDTVLIALSGGPDSMVLLDFFKTIKEELGLKIICFHLNHMLRGKESDEDEKFVIDYCEKEKIQLIAKRVDVKNYVEENKLSLEDGARRVRYDLLEQSAKEVSADKVALGHQADDQVETFIMRILRGVGLDGLTAIRPVRGIFIRPLLKIYRNEILEYIKSKKIGYRIDKSNADPSFFRNRVRAQAVPVLDKLFPSWKKNLLNTIDLLADDTDFINREASESFEKISEVNEKAVLDLTSFEKLNISIKRRAIRGAIQKILGSLMGIEFKNTEEVLSQIDAGQNFSLSLPKNIAVKREYGKLLILLGKEEIMPVEKKLNIPGETLVGERRLKIVADIVKKPENLKAGKITAYLDKQALKQPVILRSTLPGDRFSPLGMKGTKKVHDYMIDRKVPPSERRKALVLSSDNEIYWLVGYEISEKAKVTDTTTSIVKIQVKTL